MDKPQTPQHGTPHSHTPQCMSCQGTGEAPTDFGVVDCPDCGGSGLLPTHDVLIEWRARDIERALGAGRPAQSKDVTWLIAELRAARMALTEIIALAHDAQDPDAIAQKIRFTANRALGLYSVAKEPLRAAQAPS
jgi:hypothetical protein